MSSIGETVDACVRACTRKSGQASALPWEGSSGNDTIDPISRSIFDPSIQRHRPLRSRLCLGGKEEMPLIVRFSPKSPTACFGGQRARLHPERFLDGNERKGEKEREAVGEGGHVFRKPDAGRRRDLKTRARIYRDRA